MWRLKKLNTVTSVSEGQNGSVRLVKMSPPHGGPNEHTPE